MSTPVRSAPVLAAVVLLAGLAVPAPAPARPASPAAAGGPPFSVPEASLQQGLRCPGQPGRDPGSDRGAEPVLLVHATFTYGAEQFGWNWGRALPERGLGHCLVSYPDRGFGDQQVAAEYVARAVQLLHRRTGRPVDVVGHSQGGLLARWAVTFWPSVRAAVDDLVSLAAPHHGIGPARPTRMRRPASFWQLGSGSAYLAALNRGDETPGEIDYTQIYSRQDGLVGPVDGRSTGALDRARAGPAVANVLLQEVCPRRVVGHVATGTTDRLAFELAVDALTHPGPADPTRLARPGACRPPRSIAARPLRELWPGLLVRGVLRGLPDLHLTGAEPPLQPYAR